MYDALDGLAVFLPEGTDDSADGVFEMEIVEFNNIIIIVYPRAYKFNNNLIRRENPIFPRTILKRDNAVSDLASGFH